MTKGDTKTNNFLDITAHGTRVDLAALRGSGNTRTQDLILDVADRVINVEEGVERLGNALNNKIGGDLSALTTTDKTSLIAAIDELVARVAALEN